MVNDRKVAIVGCGFVGSSSAFALMQSGLFSEMVLIDVDKDRAEGEALDISHGTPFGHPMKIYAGDYEDAADAAIIVVTAGAAQKPGETRLDLVNKNVSIFKSIIPRIREVGFEGILLIVSNPVDVLTYAAMKMSGLPQSHVLAPVLCWTPHASRRLWVPTGRRPAQRSRLHHRRAWRLRACSLVFCQCFRCAPERFLRDARSLRSPGVREEDCRRR